jgi:hypothetical protein
VSDVLIRGVKMPKGCGGCPCSIYGACDAVKGRKSLPAGYRWSANKRPKWCPLIALPENHGPLIDASKLMKHYAWWGENDEQRELFDVIIDQQETIVPAEEDT